MARVRFTSSSCVMYGPSVWRSTRRVSGGGEAVTASTASTALTALTMDFRANSCSASATTGPVMNVASGGIHGNVYMYLNPGYLNPHRTVRYPETPPALLPPLLSRPPATRIYTLHRHATASLIDPETAANGQFHFYQPIPTSVFSLSFIPRGYAASYRTWSITLQAWRWAKWS